VPSQDVAVEGKDLGFQCQQLSPQSSHAGPCNIREPSIIDVGDNFEQLLNTFAPDRRHDPELGKMGAD
jgi:hypothetical protein